MVVGGSGYDLRLKGSWDLVTWVATETILIATYGSGVHGFRILKP